MATFIKLEKRFLVGPHLGDGDPIVHGHVGGVEERVVLVDGVDHAFVALDVRKDDGEQGL